MLAGKWESFRESIFGVFYVMTEQSNHEAKRTRWGTVRRTVLYLLDAGQVIKALIVPEFGWSPPVGMFMQNFDFVPAVLSLVPHPLVPSLLSFVVAVALVLLAIADTVLVRHIFQHGKTSQLWPVIVLRILVTTLVTTFFMTIFRFLLFPFDCFTPGNTLSNWMEGDGAICRPWASPMVAVTVPALVLATIFAAFSLTVTLLSFEVNPISQLAGNSYSGRVDTIWNSTRTLVAIIRYLQAYITPVAALVLVGLQVLFLISTHLKTLPFHNHEFNVLRSGIYCMVLWTILSSLIALSNKKSGDDFALGQWGLIMGIPLVFILGACLAEYKKRSTLHYLKLLRKEFLKESASTSQGDEDPSKRTLSGRLDSKKCSSAYAEFFDGDCKMTKGFESAKAAHLALRVLLYEKDERDIPFLSYLLRRALSEHPASKDLIILDLLLLRFVFCDKHNGIWQERVTKLGSVDLPLDLKYTLYAVERKVFQYEAGVNLGKEGISAIHLMEFSGKFSHAREMHLECVVLFKAIWKAAVKCKRSNSIETANELIACFSKASDAVLHTQQCYEELLEKFPGSASLRLDYAKFCDIILNDFAKAEHHSHRAALLETGQDVGIERDVFEAAECRTVPRTGSCASSTVSYRTMQRQFLASWSGDVMASQLKSIRRLNFVILGLGFVMMLVSTFGFLILQYYLYLDVMVERLTFLERARNLKINIFRCCYELRNLQLMAILQQNATTGLEAATAESRNTLQTLARVIGDLQSLNYVSSPSVVLSDFFLSEHLPAKSVYPGLSELRKYNSSFWQLGNDFVQSVLTASEITLEELRNPDYGIDTMSEQKRSVVFIYENVFTLTGAIKTFLNLILSEVIAVKDITSIVINSLLTIQTLLIAAIGLYTIRCVTSVFPTCQHCAVGSQLVYSLPTVVLKKVYKFYVKGERDMELMDDEAAAKQELEQETEPQQTDDEHNITKSFHYDQEQRSELLNPQLSSFKSRGDIIDDLGGDESEIASACRGERSRKVQTLQANKRGELEDGSNKMSHAMKGSLVEMVDHKQVHPLFITGSHISRSRHAVMPLTVGNLQQHVHRETLNSSFTSNSDPARRLHAMYADHLFSESCKWPQPAHTPHASAFNYGSHKSMADSRAQPLLMNSGSTKLHISGCESADSKTSCLPQAGRALIANGCNRQPLVTSDKADHRNSSDTGITGEHSEFSSAVSAISNRSEDGEEVRSLVELVPESGHISHECQLSFSSLGCSDLQSLTEIDAKTTIKWEGPDPGRWQAISKSLVLASRPSLRRQTEHLTGADSDSLRDDVFEHKPGAKDGEATYAGRAAVETMPKSNPKPGSFMSRMTRMLRFKGTHGSWNESCESLNQDVLIFNQHVVRATDKSLAWYFSGTIYKIMFVLVIAVCFCVWLIPTRLVPDLINASLLVRRSRNVSGDVMEAVFSAREMVLADGFSRLTRQEARAHLTQAKESFLASLNYLRFGGDGVIYDGADHIDSPIMDRFKEGMYQAGCPWRINASNCSVPKGFPDAGKGLFKLLMEFYQSMDIVATKYAIGDNGPSKSSEDMQFKNVQNIAAMEHDRDLHMLTQNRNGDIFEGLDWIETLFYDEQRSKFVEMQQESDLLLSVYVILVVGVFYFVIFRTSIAKARKEVAHTRSFVNFIPTHILTREETEHIQRFFVGRREGEADDALDAA